MSGQQAKIIKYFIKSSPVNELGLILKDVEVLANPQLLQSDEVKMAMREYFETHRQQFKLADGRIVFVNKMWRQNPITEEDGSLHEFVYFDQKHNVKFSFDPRTLEITERGVESDFPIELDEEWGAYK